MVETVEDAELAARSCRWSSDGLRSCGTQTTRVDPFAAGYRPICAVQEETATAVENLDRMAAVDGVDWLNIGPADLGLSLGGVPAPDVPCSRSTREPTRTRASTSTPRWRERTGGFPSRT